jgi:hypothetical protein
MTAAIIELVEASQPLGRPAAKLRQAVFDRLPGLSRHIYQRRIAQLVRDGIIIQFAHRRHAVYFSTQAQADAYPAHLAELAAQREKEKADKLSKINAVGGLEFGRPPEIMFFVVDSLEAAGTAGLSAVELKGELAKTRPSYQRRGIHKNLIRLCAVGKIFKGGDAELKLARYFLNQSDADLYTQQVIERKRQAKHEKDQAAACLVAQKRREREQREAAKKVKVEKPRKQVTPGRKAKPVKIPKSLRVSNPRLMPPSVAWAGQEPVYAPNYRKTVAKTHPGRYEVTELPADGFMGEWAQARKTGRLPQTVEVTQ